MAAPAPAYQELRGAMQALEAAALAGAQINISQIKGDERLAAELGVEQRALSEFVEHVRATGIAGAGDATPVTLTAAQLARVAAAGGGDAATGGSGLADIAVMHAATLVGQYHAWRIKSSYPVPGSMLVDDYRRRFLSMYAAQEERALVPVRRERERAAEVRVAVADRFDAQHRLPSRIEELLGALEATGIETVEAVQANARIETHAPASDAHMGVMALINAPPPVDTVAIEALFARGEVSTTMVDAKGASGLMVAVSRGLLSVVRLFLRAGADASFSNPRGITVLHCAWDMFNRLDKHHPRRGVVYLQCAAIVNALLEYGADANRASSNGLTPLHLAASHGHDNIVAMLLRHGADRTLLDTKGRTAAEVASGRGHRACAQIIANWGHVEAAYKREEWRNEWSRTLGANAAAVREALRKEGAWGGGGALSGAARKRAEGALWGASAASTSVSETLADMHTVEALAAHRAVVQSAAGNSASRHADPRLAAMGGAVKTVEYDMTRDAMREVDHIADAEAAGEMSRAAELRAAALKSDVPRLPWARRLPVTAASAAEEAHVVALREEDAELAAQAARADEEKAALLENVGAGAAADMATARASGRVADSVLNPHSASARAMRGDYGGSNEGASANVVRSDDVLNRSEGVFGREGSGAFMPPSLLEELRIAEAAKAQSDAIAAAHRASLEARRAAIRASSEPEKDAKDSMGGQWLKNKFGIWNFVKDKTVEELAAEEQAKEFSTSRKALRQRFEDATLIAREDALGKVQRQRRYAASLVEAAKEEEELAVDEDTRVIAEYNAHTARLQEWYEGKHSPKSDGSFLAARRYAAALLVRADAPSNLGKFTVAVNDDTNQAVLTRRPALMSTLLRPRRMRTDNLATLDADRVVAEGAAFATLLRGGDVLKLPLPPGDAPLRKVGRKGDGVVDVEGSADGVSRLGAATLVHATPSVALLAQAAGTEEEEAAHAQLAMKGKHLLAGAGLLIPRRTGYGELAANDARVLPASGALRIAAESAPLQPVGTSKAEVLHRAQDLHTALTGAGGGAAESPMAKMRRVRTLLVEGRNALVDELDVAEEARKAANRERNEAARVARMIPAADKRTVVPGQEADEKVRLRLKEAAEKEQRTRDMLSARVLGLESLSKGKGTLVKLEGKVGAAAMPAALAAAAAQEAAEAKAEAEEEAAAAAKAEAKALAAKRKRREELGAEPPVYGTSSMQSWPLHRPGQLPAFADAAGVPQALLTQSSSALGRSDVPMVYRHYAVLDSVEAARDAADAAEAAAAKAFLNRSAAVRKAELVAVRAAAKEAKAREARRVENAARRGLPPPPPLKAPQPPMGRGATAAARARAAAVAALETSASRMTTIAQLMTSGGAGPMVPATTDRAIPILTRGAQEAEEMLHRVKPLKEWQTRREEEEADTRSSRDRPLDFYHGVRDPWIHVSGTMTTADGWRAALNTVPVI